MASAPAYDPELGEDLTYFGALYGYYGIAPFWGTAFPMNQGPPTP